MKYSRFISYIFMILLLYGCSDTWLDRMWLQNVDNESKIEENSERIATLEEMVSMANTDISSLQTLVYAIRDSDSITSVNEFSEDGRSGYIVSFKSGKSIRIYDGIDGKDRPMPEIGIKEDADGKYCWTIGGEWLVDENGSRVSCEGKDAIVPEVRISDGYWEISYDEGNTWTEIGRADGQNKDTLFESIETTGSEVIFNLSDGTSFTLPLYCGVSIEFDIEGDETGIEARKEIYVNYVVTNATEKTVVTAASDGNYRVRVDRKNISEGTIVITSPKFYEDGHVSVSVYDGNGYSMTRIINFYEREISFPNGLEYRVPARGTTITIPLSANFDYNIEIPAAPWLYEQQSQTRAEMQDRTITVTAEMNNDFIERTGIVELIALNNPDEPQSEITVIQSAADFSIDRKRFVLMSGEQQFRCTVRTSLDIEVSDISEDWLTYSLDRQEENVFIISGSVSANSGAGREAEIRISNRNTGSYLDAIEIVQLQDGAENPDDMIFSVRANQVNDYTVCLPLSGNVDCIVDWGDGNTEHVTSEKPNHFYDVSDATDFIVRISGAVTSLSSNDIKALSVTKVLQWGKTGLNSMNQAFYGNSLLTSIPTDDNGAFSDVGSFSEAFGNCTNLTEIPSGIFRFCGNASTFYRAFSGCKSLTVVPDNLFSGCSSADNFGSAFSYCSSLQYIPENIFNGCTNVIDFGCLFENCTSLREIPERIFWDCINVSSFRGLFWKASIETVPEKIFWNCEDVTSFNRAFASCNSLIYVPVNVFDNNRKVTDFEYAFSSCNNLGGESPYTIIAGIKYHLYERYKAPDYFVTPLNFGYCFSGSKNLSDYGDMPEEWK